MRRRYFNSYSTELVNKYFTVYSLEDNLNINFLRPAHDSVELYYNINDTEWVSGNTDLTFTLNTNEYIRFKGFLYTSSVSLSGIGTFQFSKKCFITGSTSSLIFGDNIKNSLKNMPYVFRSLFEDCATLISVDEDLLPYTELSDGCYLNTFKNCTSLEEAPKLPALKLTNSCYNGMFSYCTNLKLVHELPATELANSCYKEMFRGCTNLKTAPVIYGIHTVEDCYVRMFYMCTNLKYIKSLFITTMYGHRQDWVYGVSDNGTFINNKDLESWVSTDDSGYPIFWTVISTDVAGTDIKYPLTIEHYFDTNTFNIDQNTAQNLYTYLQTVYGTNTTEQELHEEIYLIFNGLLYTATTCSYSSSDMFPSSMVLNFDGVYLYISPEGNINIL